MEAAARGAGRPLSWGLPVSGGSLSWGLPVSGTPCLGRLAILRVPCLGASLSRGAPCLGGSLSWGFPVSGGSLSRGAPCLRGLTISGAPVSGAPCLGGLAISGVPCLRGLPVPGGSLSWGAHYLGGSLSRGGLPVTRAAEMALRRVPPLWPRPSAAKPTTHGRHLDVAGLRQVTQPRPGEGYRVPGSPALQADSPPSEPPGKPLPPLTWARLPHWPLGGHTAPAQWGCPASG